MVMSEIATKGSDVFEIMGVAKSLSINPAHAVDIAANIITPPETLSAVVIFDVAILPLEAEITPCKIIKTNSGYNFS